MDCPATASRFHAGGRPHRKSRDGTLSWKGERRGFGERGFRSARRADDRPARFRRRRNATEWEKGPGRERKPRVGKEEGPRFRGADYESPTAYFLSIKKVGKEC